MATFKNTLILGNKLKIPTGTEAQKSSISPVTGMARYNTNKQRLEYYNGSVWKTANLDGDFSAGTTKVAQTRLTNQTNINQTTGELNCFNTSYELNDAGFYTVGTNGFTVSEAGYYEFSCQATMQNIDSTRTNPGLIIYVNGTEITNPRVRSLSAYSRDTNDDNCGTNITVLLNLNANDRVGIGFQAYAYTGTVALVGDASVANIHKISNFHGVSAEVGNASNINPSNFTEIDVLTGNSFFESGGYNVGVGGITVPDDGIYDLSFQYHCLVGSARDAPGHQFAINGIAQGPEAGMTYMRFADGHDQSSGHNQYVVRLNQNDRINNGFRQVGNSGSSGIDGSLSSMTVRKIQ